MITLLFTSKDHILTTVPGPYDHKLELSAELRARPAGWSEKWYQFAVSRRTQTRPRAPLVSRQRNPRYWRGYRLAWEEWLATVEVQGLDVAFIPALNDVVVLDCDVKSYAGELVVHSDNPNLVSVSQPVARRGIDDLVALARELGHDPAELATYCVATKSGGVHLYYDLTGRPRPRNRHHRHEWRIDVVSSANSWVAAPPTPGYRAARDLALAPVPDWLYEAIGRLDRLRRPLGAGQRSELERQRRRLRDAAGWRFTPVSQRDSGLFGRYLATLAELVRLANRVGGWNSTIFEVSCDLFALGLAPAQVEELVLGAAEPWDERQRAAATATIASARAYKLDAAGVSETLGTRLESRTTTTAKTAVEARGGVR
jgi:hypothetical protein